MSLLGVAPERSRFPGELAQFRPIERGVRADGAATRIATPICHDLGGGVPAQIWRGSSTPGIWFALRQIKASAGIGRRDGLWRVSGYALIAYGSRTRGVRVLTIPEADLPAVYSEAMALVMLHWPRVSVAALEALCCGTPLSCRRTRHGRGVRAARASLVDPYDVRSIADGSARAYVADRRPADPAAISRRHSWSVGRTPVDALAASTDSTIPALKADHPLEA